MPVPPVDSRDFWKAAVQRFESAVVLLQAGRTLDAQYLGGYAVECALKSLILHLTPEADRPARLAAITTSAAMHRPEVLLGLLRPLGVALTPALAKRMRSPRFDWGTDLRYESGRRDTGETIAFLKTVELVTTWVKGQLP